MKKLLALLLLLFILSGAPAPAFAQTKSRNGKSGANGGATGATAARFGNTDGISAQQLRNYLEFIASDELEGRDTPSRGLDIAAMYIADHLRAWGVKPAGDKGSYFQRFPLRRHKIDASGTRLTLNNQNFVYGEDFLSSFHAANVANAPLVYASHGWLIKSKNIDALQGLDVKDKIVVVANNLPKGVSYGDLQGKHGEDWAEPALNAQLKGARAVIMFGSYTNLANWQATRWTQVEKGGLEFGKPQSALTIPTITAGPRLINALFFGEKSSGNQVYTRGITQDFVDGFDLKAAKKISLSVAVKSDDVYSQNVIGVLEGSDPVLKNEYVAIGAHYDHVGMNPFWNGDDKIWNGADDDGSGTVAVLSMAEAFSKGAARPKRSILFIWVAGEEKGLWGSEYFTDNPTVPLSSIVTQLNIDMIGRAQAAGDENQANKALPKPGEVFVIGSKLMSTELGEVSEATNKAFLNMSFNYKYDDPKDPEQFFYRSDHYNFARKGIPIIFYMDGSHADYHQTSDSIEKIDFVNMEKIARTIFATGWELANRPTRPKVDKPLQLGGN
ncbi:MAG TPA: M28 family peptidase [Pyrinomonadaceae bacterium]|jgi:hypothetical protein